jgi:hypothetical protein
MDLIKNNNYYHPTSTTTEKLAATEQKMGDVSVADGIGAAVKIWDDHIERLEAKLSFLIRSYDGSRPHLIYQYEKKIATLKREINDAMEQRQTLIGRRKLVLLGNR